MTKRSCKRTLGGRRLRSSLPLRALSLRSSLPLRALIRQRRLWPRSPRRKRTTRLMPSLASRVHTAYLLVGGTTLVRRTCVLRSRALSGRGPSAEQRAPAGAGKREDADGSSSSRSLWWVPESVWLERTAADHSDGHQWRTKQALAPSAATNALARSIERPATVAQVNLGGLRG